MAELSIHRVVSVDIVTKDFSIAEGAGIDFVSQRLTIRTETGEQHSLILFHSGGNTSLPVEFRYDWEEV